MFVQKWPLYLQNIQNRSTPKIYKIDCMGTYNITKWLNKWINLTVQQVCLSSKVKLHHDGIIFSKSNGLDHFKMGKFPSCRVAWSKFSLIKWNYRYKILKMIQLPRSTC